MYTVRTVSRQSGFMSVLSSAAVRIPPGVVAPPAAPRWLVVRLVKRCQARESSPAEQVEVRTLSWEQ